MALPSRSELSELFRAHAPEIRGMGARSLSVFGSFARGDQRAASDVDLLVEFEPGQKSYDNFIQLAFLLEEIAGRRVELLTRESLSPHLAAKILAEAQDVPLGP